MKVAALSGSSARKEKVPKIKILLADDHPFVRAGVRAFLQQHAHLHIVGEAGNGPEAILQARESSPDVVLMDLEMPGGDGLEATARLREICPQARVLILTMKAQEDLDRELIQSGARGYLRKDASPSELLSAIEMIHRGETCFRPEVAQAFFKHYILSGGNMEQAGPKRLSPREQEVLNGIVQGLANKEIADRLQIRLRTVEKHRQRMMSKLKIHKATELVKYALTRGLVTLNAA